MMNAWPTQAGCDAFYGNPRSRVAGVPSAAWEAKNIVRIAPPFKMFYDGKMVSTIRIHRLCAESLARVFKEIWEKSGKSQIAIHNMGMDKYTGAYNFRLMRGSAKLSMHSWGCAIDLDAERNAFHDRTPNFMQHPIVTEAFAREKWTWGGTWKGDACDGMHFQAAWV